MELKVLNMQDNHLNNISAMFLYTEWNQEMINLYNKYSLVRELNHDLMKRCPVYAMYTLSEYLKRKKVDMEIELNEAAKSRYGKISRTPEEISRVLKEIELSTYETLKPIVQDYVVARSYYVKAMSSTQEEYQEYLLSRDESIIERKVK